MVLILIWGKKLSLIAQLLILTSHLLLLHLHWHSSILIDITNSSYLNLLLHTIIDITLDLNTICTLSCIYVLDWCLSSNIWRLLILRINHLILVNLLTLRKLNIHVLPSVIHIGVLTSKWNWLWSVWILLYLVLSLVLHDCWLIHVLVGLHIYKVEKE